MSIFSRARELANATPPARNRYVDFLRAAAILVVVFGHWLAAAPYMTADGLKITSMLGVAAWSHLLTWALQVMPIFFIVGGYSNSISWEAAGRDGVSYGDWVHGRLRRLVTPLVPLLLTWAGLVIVAHVAGVPAELIKNASRLALIPTWFLAVYIMVILLVPAAARAWSAYGLASFWLPVSAAVLVDSLAFGRGLDLLRWINYLFVWVAVHQLGFLWRSGQASQREVAAAWFLGGLAFLVFLVQMAGYPVAMLTVPGAEFSNTRPPTVALAALAGMQFGLLNLTQPFFNRWLQRPGPWAATVLINGVIMTVFLWHSTVQTLVIGGAALMGGVGLELEPGSGAWWLARPAWLLAMLLVLLPFVALFGRFEQVSRRPEGEHHSGNMQVAGALCLCLGVAMLAWQGMSSDHFPWLRWLPLGFALAGAAMVLGRFGRSRPV